MFKRFALFAATLVAAVLSTTPHLQARKPEVKNIVLVHGAWVDGSGWRGVYDILTRDGFQVNIVQEPETSFQEDVTATKRVLALQDGPYILAAHSYGGAVITEAGTDPSIAGLVYIAAHMEVAGASHSVYVSHPKEVADVIESAARAVSKVARTPQGARSTPRGAK